jgi:hypothetical protein
MWPMPPVVCRQTMPRLRARSYSARSWAARPQRPADLLDKLEKATPEQRRKVLDDARVKGGMLDTATVDARERVRRASHTASVKAGTDHRPLRLAYTDTGGIVDLNERDDDAARARHQEESRRHMREHREAERAVEAAAHAEHERAVEAAFRRELPPGFPA